METLTSPKPNKPGRKPQGLSRQIHVLVQGDLKNWVECHPEGASQLVRRLLREEYERQRRPSHAPSA